MQFLIQEAASAGSGLSQDARLLLDRWRAAAPGLGPVPSSDLFAPDDLWCSNDTLLVVRSDSGSFRYLHYGVRISAVTGFDMTGALTADFRSRTGQ